MMVRIFNGALVVTQIILTTNTTNVAIGQRAVLY